MSNSSNFAQRLAEAIEYKGISQAELSRRSGVGRNSISDYLKGKYQAKQESLSLLAEALGVDEPWLMGIDVPMNSKSEETYKLLKSTYDQLNDDNKNEVLNFAKYKLNDQKSSNFYSLVAEEPAEYITLAAHAIDPNRKYTDSDIEEINNFLDDLDKKYDNKKNK